LNHWGRSGVFSECPFRNGRQEIQTLDQLDTMCYRSYSINPGSKARMIEGAITANVRVPAGSPWFDGHFPGFAVLPGVAQLAIVAGVLEEALDVRVRVTDVSRVRFKTAVLPDQLLEVRITAKENDPLTYGFRLVKEQELVCSGWLRVRA
jgi:3-hydroxyacyl-[acyl-carrier-protein] dehydratase